MYLMCYQSYLDLDLVRDIVFVDLKQNCMYNYNKFYIQYFFRRISRRKRSRGRRFYNCPKPYSRKWNSQCDYFEWADQPREPLHVLVTLVCGHCRKKGHKTINCFLA